MMRVLDLFSGIGAFSLGLERAGMRTTAFCEIDPYCRRVLAKHWPGVPQYHDVRELTADRLHADGIWPEFLCGGFPCQDISVAGKGAGIGGGRSGLWSEFARLIGAIRPRYALIENVAALLGRGMGDVLCDLAALGFDAEWHCIPASAVGAPHIRDRIWIVAYAIGEGLEGSAGLAGHDAEQCAPAQRGGALCDAGRLTPARHRGIIGEIGQSDWWRVEPDVGRVAHGIASRVDRLRGLGNSLVPQIPELIGRAILAREDAASAQRRAVAA